MAKMFYTLAEAAEKLGASEADVREMVKSGRVQEFRDRDKLMFKVEQIDLLMSDEDHSDPADMSSMIPLAGDSAADGFSLADSVGADLGFESGTGSDLIGGTGSQAGDLNVESGSQSGISLGESGAVIEPGVEAEGDPGHKTGVSIFDTDDLDTADPAAVTQVTGSGLDDLTLESVGSGSGLMELTRESDDTSLGAELLEDLYSEEESAPAPSGEGLFEGAESDTSAVAAPAAAGALVAAEPYDGAGSGLVAGLALAAVVALSLGLVVVIYGMMDINTGGFTDFFASQFWPVIGALAALAALGGGIGFVIGKKS